MVKNENIDENCKIHLVNYLLSDLHENPIRIKPVDIECLVKDSSTVKLLKAILKYPKLIDVDKTKAKTPSLLEIALTHRMIVQKVQLFAPYKFWPHEFCPNKF